VTVNYNSSGDQLPTVLGTAVEGGNPPDLAVLPQPGLMQEYADRGELQSIDFARDAMEENFAEDWLTLGTVDDTLYGLVFKGANKSTVWYNVNVFNDAGVEPPETWDDLLSVAEQIGASGVPAYSIAGADGWTLTDLFENIYLRTAGPDMYDQLADHEIPWTDDSVRVALERMADMFADTQNIAGGTQGALQTDFPTSVTQVFTEDPEAAMVFEGDFVQGVIQDSSDAQPQEDFDVFTFPSVDDSGPSVMGGGDMVVMFNDTEAGRAFVQYLATPESAEIWAERGGFSSPNQNVNADVYPDDLTRQTATDLAEAETFRFDLSDLAPSEFGGTPGQGMWQILQDFLQNPDDIDGTQQRLEQAASQAYGN
jgi:alpha-glucoside transport system substrate-binding protein